MNKNELLNLLQKINEVTSDAKQAAREDAQAARRQTRENEGNDPEVTRDRNIDAIDSHMFNRYGIRIVDNIPMFNHITQLPGIDQSGSIDKHINSIKQHFNVYAGGRPHAPGDGTTTGRAMKRNPPTG
jgi:hypothetical protein